MIPPFITLFLSFLVFLLKGLVHLENFWYKVVWSKWRPASTTVLDKLTLSKENEIWHAVIFGRDGDVKGLFEDLTHKPQARGTSSTGATATSSKVEAGAWFHRPKTKLQEAVETDVEEHMFSGRRETYENAVQDRLKAIADGLANSNRTLTRREKAQAQQSSDGPFSLLWMTFHQKRESDWDYLLTERNQKLHTRNGWLQRTVLHQAVSNQDLALVQNIFEKSSYTSPHTYIDVGDFASRTALHTLVFESVFNSLSTDAENLRKTTDMFDLLCRYGANINALDAGFRTPLHLLLSLTLLRKDWHPEYACCLPQDTLSLLKRFLEARAEVNTKDIEGKSPLHIACELGNRDAIKQLVLKGADPESLNHDWKTPRRVFLDCHGPADDFWKNMAILSREKPKTAPDLPGPSKESSQRHNRIPKAAMAVCKKSAVYCRYQWNDLAAESRDPLHWTATDKYVSDVFDPTHLLKDTTFLAECDKECQSAWNDPLEPFQADSHEDEHEHKPPAGKASGIISSVTLANYTWRWVNFPANNITWIRTDISTWKFFEDKMKVHDMRYNGSPIRVPHAYMMTQGAPNPSKKDHIENNQNKSVVSLVIPFIDIEVKSSYRSIATQIEEAYSPFTGFHGVQMPQTLDQTSINAESRSKLRNKENQVIYRWSQNKNSEQDKQLPLSLTVRNPHSKLAYLLRTMREKIESHEKKESKSSSSGRVGRGGRGERAGISPEIQRIRNDRRPKWLMVRQLWLWKLNDGKLLLL
ncbi:ankyrin repeat kinase domain-containing protein [Fusarium circinatum]|uniref:Ankyrin repeat kinase domain-containing protein n=1 Tax=Fusarium circinatum TaxID=48490 RepID=A0A8H5T9F6_FUSCI|nr:ankyrin repeat kinase domain-containing protein [Fusarium circinatum]